VQNVELKARVRDLQAARRTAERLATQHLGTEHQVDTYFHCPRARLKLREIEGQSAQLVAYLRPDETGPKLSDYRLTTVIEAESLKQTLAAALGVLGVVDKQREIFLYQNVRIHLDKVTGLGTFLEFEAVLSADVDEAQGQAQIAFLRNEFAIQPEELLAVSYADLLLRKA
jgi:adenylate cyclase class 2